MGSVHSSAQQTGPMAKPLFLPHPRVQTAKGQVEGFRHQLADGRPVNVFLGIPFAKPPLGHLRFQRPVEPDGWQPEVFLAKKYRQRSIQMNFLHTDMAEMRAGKAEDCLHLNVIGPGWRPKEGEGTAGFPVMFYIHGGAFLIDSAVKYEHKKIARTLVHHGVLVVVIQYRLGLLGFFSTGDTSCPGNFGLWDQLAALQWTKRNIAAFGGDPGRITLFGQSAGAASADLLGVLPLSRDLFAQSILMAGNAECSWAVLPKKELVLYCRKWALKMGFKCQKPVEAVWAEEDNKAMMDFLRGLPASKFELNSLGAMREMFGTIRLPLGPLVDGHLIPRSPKLLRGESPSKRVIAGICRNEGMLFLPLAMKRANAKLLAQFECQIVELFEKAKAKGSSNGTHLNGSNILSDFYGMDRQMRANKMAVEKACVTLLGDFINNVALENFCSQSLANGSTLFRYSFDHFNADNTRALNPLMPLKGPTHATELAFVFDVNMFGLPWARTKEDRQAALLGNGQMEGHFGHGMDRCWRSSQSCGQILPNLEIQMAKCHRMAQWRRTLALALAELMRQLPLWLILLPTRLLCPFTGPQSTRQTQAVICALRGSRHQELASSERARVQKLAAVYRANVQ